MGIETLQNKLDILKDHCEKLGRDYAEIEKTALNTVHLAEDKMNPRDVIEECRKLAGIGISHVIFNMPNVDEITPLKTFGEEIIPAVSEL